MNISDMGIKFLIICSASFVLTSMLTLFVSPYFVWLLLIIIPIFILGIFDLIQGKHAIRRNYPILGRLRYVMEFLRPGIQQYFVESDLSGRPFNRRIRSLVYQRAKDVTETVPFGTQVDVYEEGYEWISHSIYAKDSKMMNQEPRVQVGSSSCKKPYNLSIFNISAMSYGSLSANAIKALNGGAKKGNFIHNTGEGGVSPYHLEPGGDLLWQIGTGYFSCRADDGNFSAERFLETIGRCPQIKMIEIKLSQGAKPGHGGILPAKKNTPEIAKIRGVQPGVDVNSPPYHKAFDSPEGLLAFIQKVRDLSGGLPVGFKLCIGSEIEFYDICLAMTKTKIFPDFITVDGGEGGTGAAPIEFSDYVGMPLRDALSFVDDILRGFDIRKDIIVIASGRIMSGFDIAKNLALGADACNSARGMMLALGCIQALECNTNKCPTGVATQDEGLMKGLVVSDKTDRVFNFHNKTVHAFVELLGASGLTDPSMLERKHIYRRVSASKVLRYDQIYPVFPTGCLIGSDDIPNEFKRNIIEKVV